MSVRRLLIILLLSTQPFFGWPALAQPQVSVTIKPLQLIASGVTGEISSPVLILQKDQDPHHPALRPSERRAIANAEILLWVGPVLENALQDVLAGQDGRLVTAYNLLARQQRILVGNSDPHIWLDTGNARIIARSLAAVLAEQDPQNADVYNRNLRDFISSLDELDIYIVRELEVLPRKTFAVYHNAFQYYERQFGLEHAVSFTQQEEIQPGIRRILEIRDILQRENVGCILISPSVNPDELETLIGIEGLHLASIDVLGLDVPAGSGGYVTFMRAVTDAIVDCLG